MFGIDFAEVTNWAIPLGFLLLVDALLGALAAWRGGTFKASWLYLFATTKGLAYIVGLMLLVVGAVAPDLSGLEVAEGFFSTLGIGFLSPLGISVVASIAGNVSQLASGIGDLTPPTGAPPPLGDIELPEVPEDPPA